LYQDNLISIIAPIRNEENTIEEVLHSLKKQSLPESILLEIILIDGMSDDDTINIISRFKDANLSMNIKILKNKNRYIPFALNIGLKESSGLYICRIDTHTVYPKDYIKNCYETIKAVDADNVGGYIITKKFDNSIGANIVQALVTHKFGVGNSGFRVGREDGLVDTVPYGFFKKAIFDKVGNFNEKLIRTQDYEMNRRIKKEGGKVWFSNKIYSINYNQKSFIDFLKKQFFWEAPFNVYMWYIAPYTLAFRHAITLFFSAGVIGGIFIQNIFPLKIIYFSVLFLYLLLAIISSIQQVIRYKKLVLLPLLPLCFFLYHFIHGIGMIIGFIKILLNISPVQKNNLIIHH
tara:strand:- start:27374 stop:28417 length:1044 start_codon:yes stop_codon:yes gene_type:complete